MTAVRSVIQFRVTPDEDAKVRADAEAAGESLTDWIKHRLGLSGPDGNSTARGRGAAPVADPGVPSTGQKEVADDTPARPGATALQGAPGSGPESSS